MFYWETKKQFEVLVVAKFWRGRNALEMNLFVSSHFSGPDDNVFVYFTDHGATGKCDHFSSNFSFNPSLFIQVWSLFLTAQFVSISILCSHSHVLFLALRETIERYNHSNVHWKEIQTSNRRRTSFRLTSIL